MSLLHPATRSSLKSGGGWVSSTLPLLLAPLWLSSEPSPNDPSRFTSSVQNTGPSRKNRHSRQPSRQSPNDISHTFVLGKFASSTALKACRRISGRDIPKFIAGLACFDFNNIKGLPEGFVHFLVWLYKLVCAFSYPCTGNHGLTRCCRTIETSR